jgi:O-acetyl-ADP-ribose deacetylase (regulator of RNase III)
MLECLSLVHPDKAMCEAFRDRFATLPKVRVIRGLFEDLDSHDCFVTAGNAFGLMTAGIDAAVIRRFGEQLMLRVQQRIMDQYLGEQPVIYSATWAAFLAILAHNQSSDQPIATVALPAMGTGFGGVPFDEAARQMAAAYRHLLEPPHRLDWDFVVERHRAICYDGSRQVVR